MTNNQLILNKIIDDQEHAEFIQSVIDDIEANAINRQIQENNKRVLWNIRYLGTK